MTFEVNDLPEEIKRLITEELQHDVESLRSLCLVSSTFRAIAEPVLYRHNFFRSGCQCARLLQSIEARDERALNVREIDARFEYAKEEGIARLPEILRKAVNLRELTFEGPYANYRYYVFADDWDRLMELLFQPFVEALQSNNNTLTPPRPLQELKKLTLHCNGQGVPHWPLNNTYSAILMHPSLTDLTISCAEIEDEVLADTASLTRTPLQHLTLIECLITHDGLHRILSKPRALETLHIGETNSYDGANKDGFYNQLVTRDCTKFVAAIIQQKASLRELSYRPELMSPSLSQTSRPMITSSGCESFSACEKLENIRLQLPCPPFLELISGETTAPPNVRKIEASINKVNQKIPLDHSQEDSLVIDAKTCRSQVHNLCSHASSRPKLEEFAISMQSSFPNKIDAAWRYLVEAAYQNFDSRHTRLVVIQEPEYPSFVPPYLYGETPPTQTVVYDNRAGGWVVDEDETYTGWTASTPPVVIARSLATGDETRSEYFEQGEGFETFVHRLEDSFVFQWEGDTGQDIELV